MVLTFKSSTSAVSRAFSFRSSPSTDLSPSSFLARSRQKSHCCCITPPVQTDHSKNTNVDPPWECTQTGSKAGLFHPCFHQLGEAAGAVTTFLGEARLW